jgi:ribulose-5-phosphate 4-epimerase/fuculose-1-phosphate aldolase
MQNRPNPHAGLMTQERVSDQEWQARVELAAIYRIFVHLGWTEMIFNHISLRVPDQEACFLINPFGLHYSEVCASNLIKIDINGKPQHKTAYGINPAGFVPHANIHANKPDAHCVMHSHTTAGMAVACLQNGLSMTNFYSAQLHGQVAYHDFEGITVHADEGPRLLASIGDKQAVILRNHGLLAWGKNIPATFAVLWTMQRACEVQLATQSMGAAIPIDDHVQARAAADSLQFGGNNIASQLIINALTRQIDRIDTSYLQ